MKALKIIVYVPVSHADRLRKAIGQSGGGKIGDYSFCSFSTKGIGRFLPMKGARPAVGRVGKIQKVHEERIEFVCAAQHIQQVIAAIRKAHPYEEPAIETWPIHLP